jgi:hypothetical protein
MQQLRRRRALRSTLILATIVLVGTIPAMPTAALEPISLSVPVADTGPDECPLLTRIKYPWLVCDTNAWGGKPFVPGAESDSWEQDRSIPTMSQFTEGTGHWGPSH